MARAIIGYWQFDHLIGDDPHDFSEIVKGKLDDFPGIVQKGKLDSIIFYPDNSFDARLTVFVKLGGDIEIPVPHQVTGEYKFVDEKTIKYNYENVTNSDEVFAVSEDELTLYNPIKKYKQVFKRTR